MAPSRGDGAEANVSDVAGGSPAVVIAKKLLLSEQACFNPHSPVSDHLPQAYEVVFLTAFSAKADAGNNDERRIHVVAWNIMGHCRGGRVGQSGTALEGLAITNNGLDHNETFDMYRTRLLDEVCPVLADFLQTYGTTPCFAALQEFPAAPVLQNEFLRKLRERSGIPTLHLAVRPSSVGCCEGGLSPLRTCSALVWNEGCCFDVAPLSGCLCAASSIGIRIPLQGRNFAVMGSVHLPFVDKTGGPRYAKAVADARAAVERVRGWAGDVGASVVILAGDFNVSVDDLQLDGECFGCFQDSSIFGGRRSTFDACLRIVPCPAASAPTDVGTRQPVKTQVAEGVHRFCGAIPFFGKTREEFVSSCIARVLQDDPRSWGLDDAALATLGLQPFAEQGSVLAWLLKRSRGSEGGVKKRARMNNPLAQLVDSGSSEGDSESYSSPE